MWEERKKLIKKSISSSLWSTKEYIHFTLEPKKDGQLSFLDTLITRHQDGTMSTSVYRKRTHTDKYLDFQSHHPLAHKLAVVRTLLCRAGSLCSVTDQDQERGHIDKKKKRNGYPPKILSHSRARRDNQTRSESDPPKTTVVLSLSEIHQNRYVGCWPQTAAERCPLFRLS